MNEQRLIYAHEAKRIARENTNPYEVIATCSVIDRTPTASPNQWVKADERLPEAPGDVLVYGGGCVVAGYMSDSGELYSYEGDMKITHWMPLPEPPEE